MVRQTLRFVAVAIAAQVAGDDGEMLRQCIRHLVPDHMGLRMAVQQEQGRTLAPFDIGDVDAVHCGCVSCESCKHVWLPDGDG
ncbi:hypothetical protein D3C81_1534910 [compost metagenome]